MLFCRVLSADGGTCAAAAHLPCCLCAAELSVTSEDEQADGGSTVAAADSLPAAADDSAPQDTGYHSTLTSLPSLSARHLAGAESSHFIGTSGSASLLASTRLDEASVLAPPAEHEPVPIGSSTPSRSQRR